MVHGPDRGCPTVPRRPHAGAHVACRASLSTLVMCARSSVELMSATVSQLLLLATARDRAVTGTIGASRRQVEWVLHQDRSMFTPCRGLDGWHAGARSGPCVGPCGSRCAQITRTSVG